MKKIAFYLFALCASFSLHAQFTISPTAGGSLTTVNYNFPEEFKTQIVYRYFAGVQSSYSFSEKFSTGIGLQYATKGYETDAANPIWNSEAKFKYLEIMPFVEYRIFRPIGLIAGGSIGLLLDEKYKSAQTDWGSPIIDTVNPLDISGSIGFKVYLHEIFVSLIYNNSLVSTSSIHYTDEQGVEVGVGKQYNQSLSIGVGYNFHLKSKS